MLIPRHRSCAAILDADEANILMVLHSHDGRTYWTLPGGGLEPGETFEQAVVREVREETGLEVEVVAHLFDEVYYPLGGAAVSRCFLVSHRPGQTIQLGHDPEQIHLESSTRMLQDLSWQPLSELVEDSQVSRVLDALARHRRALGDT